MEIRRIQCPSCGFWITPIRERTGEKVCPECAIRIREAKQKAEARKQDFTGFEGFENISPEPQQEVTEAQPWILSQEERRAIAELGRKYWILQRDGFQCRYCPKQLTIRTMTLDHVKPKVLGGVNAFWNLVTCCVSCNRRKGGRRPEQAGMTLRKIVRCG